MSDHTQPMTSDNEEDDQSVPSVITQGRRVRMTTVNMPSGHSVPVTLPAKRCNCTTCAFDVKYTDLQLNGVMGSREFQLIASEMTTTIRKHSMNAGGRFTSYNIIMIQKIENCCLWKRFREQERHVKRKNGYVNELMLFHGSPATDTIVKKGFDRSCVKPGGMFGDGIYFAKHSSKSNQYAYGHLGGTGCPAHKDKSCYVCERKVLLCRVALGKMYKQKNVNRLTQLPGNYSSVSGQPSRGGLKYPEYAIFKGQQAYPEYLITYKIVQ